MKFAMINRVALFAAAAIFLGLPGPVLAQDEDAVEELDLLSLSLADLMDVEVTIASREEQSIADVPGAVYVITGDEIRAAGHTSIPEALRLVPGLFVSRWTNNAWDVSARGFANGTGVFSFAFLNQLLVLVDGVSVYTPLFPGVWWTLQDIDMADVERIEVMRGPGGLLWGSNATHGVVNVITKDSADTQGLRVSGNYTSVDLHGSARYGGDFGETGSYRAWFKGADYEQLEFFEFSDALGWSSLSAGFRADWSDETDRDYSFNLRAYDTRIGNIGLDLVTFDEIPVVDDKSGFQVSGSVRDADAGWELTGSFLSDIQFAPTYFDTRIDVLDINYQRRFETGESSHLTLGGGWRSLWYDLQGIDTFFVDFSVQELRQDVFRLYGIHRTSFEDAGVNLTVGLTAEHNDFTQFELQPTVRASWGLTDNATVWAAASRAVRTPSIEERLIDSAVFAPLDFQSEVLWAYEVGGRSQLTDYVFVDLALFYNDYDELRVAELTDDFRTGFTNAGDGRAYGAELAVDLQPTERWKVRSAVSLIRSDYNFGEVSLETDQYYPRRQINVRSTYQLTEELQFDSSFYVVDDLGEFFEGGEYTRTDIRVGWNPSEGTEFYFGVQNLLDASHSEYLDAQILPRTAILGFNLLF